MKYHDARNVQQYAHILALICLAYERFQLRPKYTLVNGHEERYEVAPIRPSLYAIVVSGMADGIKCCLLGCKRAKSLTTIKRHIALCHKAGFKQRVEQQVKEVMDNTITETCGKYLSVFRIFHQKHVLTPARKCLCKARKPVREGLRLLSRNSLYKPCLCAYASSNLQKP